MAEALIPKYTFYQEIAIPDTFAKIISAKEKPLFAVKTIRDAAVFTDKRIIIADKQGITGKKIEYRTIPYKSIVTYSIETAGTFDFDADINLLLSGGLFIQFEFMKSKTMNELLFKVYNTITEYIV